MKIKSGFVVREVAGSTVAVPVGARSKEFHGMITLNGTGAFIWKQLEKETTEEAIVSALLAEYEVDRETAATSVSTFLSSLKEANVLE